MARPLETVPPPFPVRPEHDERDKQEQPASKYVLEAHKQVTRARHQFIMQLARQNWKREEINGVVMMIDWGSEQKWIAEDLEEKDKNPPAPAPVNIPIPPPTAAPQVNQNALHPQGS